MNKEIKYKELETIVLRRNKNNLYLPRIKKELAFIKTQGTAEFYLKALQIIENLKNQNGQVAAAGGYANSSLINYTLGFTTIDPIKYDLICESYFSLDYFFLQLNVSDKKLIQKKYLKHLTNIKLEVVELAILKKYQVNSLKPNFKFYPEKLKRNKTGIVFSKDETLHLFNWEQERQAMDIENENDLINSIAMSAIGLKGFHLSKFIQDKHIQFKELTSTNKILIYQEQWISLVAKFTSQKIDTVCKLKLSIGKKEYLQSNFKKLFANKFNEETISYLYEIVPFLPSKSQSIGESQIISLLLNFQENKTK